MWHEFTMIREADALGHSLAVAHYPPSSTSRVSYCPDNVTLRTSECVTPEPSDVNSSNKPSPARTQEQGQQRGKKRQRETESCYPLTRKIHIMQRRLHDLVQERATSKRNRASHQHISRGYGESDSATELETSDWEGRKVL